MICFNKIVSFLSNPIEKANPTRQPVLYSLSLVKLTIKEDSPSENPVIYQLLNGDTVEVSIEDVVNVL